MPRAYQRLFCSAHRRPGFCVCVVSRIKARSDLFEMDLVLDVNVDVYPLEVGDKFSLCLASSLYADKKPHAAKWEPVSWGKGGGKGKASVPSGALRSFLRLAQCPALHTNSTPPTSTTPHSNSAELDGQERPLHDAGEV
jgi:hypothetical protein